jgi:hypothetical protein
LNNGIIIEKIREVTIVVFCGKWNRLDYSRHIDLATGRPSL